jgi:hypothetical protein
VTHSLRSALVVQVHPRPTGQFSKRKLLTFDCLRTRAANANPLSIPSLR